MPSDDQLFAISHDIDVRFEMLGGKVPVLLCDGFYARPHDIRDAALSLAFRTPPYPYPGRLAQFHAANPSLDALRQQMLDLVAAEFLTRVPIARDGAPLTSFREAYTDFAVVDVHPDELTPAQTMPHTDPVPVFGLVYLNPHDRGGTLFFEQKADAREDPSRRGYFTRSSPEFELCARIEGRFNRLAIYPGFIPHSGEIAGDWIRTEERFAKPRLTHRLVFLS
jgi:hypothetical protein